MNGIDDGVQVVKVLPLWQKWLIAADIALGVIILGGACLVFLRCRKNKGN